MKRVVFNQKGGVGKSSISVNLAAISAKQGLRSLVVDLDAQCNSTHYLGLDPTEEDLTLAKFFNQTVGWFQTAKGPADFVHATSFDNLFVMPASPALSNLERELESRYKIFKLRDALNELGETFDRIYIDTPPNFNFYSKTALIAADSLLVPFDCDGFSVQAIMRLLDNIMELKTDHNPTLALEGIIVNQFNPQAKLPRTLVEELKGQSLPVLETFLTSSVKMRESHSARNPLVYMSPRHKLAQQFEHLYQEIESNRSVV